MTKRISRVIQVVANTLVVHLPEPLEIGVEIDQDRHDEGQNSQDDHGYGYPARAAVARLGGVSC